MHRSENFHAIVPAPFGAVGIRVDARALRELVYLPPGTTSQAADSGLAARAARAIERYLADPTTAFDLPVDAPGTEFRRGVWREIAAIPRGQVRTYGELAKRLKSSARAVGQACGDNPVPIVVPCHRVVGAAGIGGFAHSGDGFLIDTKRWLLRHEGVVV